MRQIRLSGQSVIVSITIDYDQNGCLVRSYQHGGHGHDIERAISMIMKVVMRFGLSRFTATGGCKDHLVLKEDGLFDGIVESDGEKILLWVGISQQITHIEILKEIEFILLLIAYM